MAPPLTGWSYFQVRTIASSTIGISTDLVNFEVPINIPSTNTAFWAHVKADGGDVRFTAYDGTTLLKKVTIKFDYAGNDANYIVKIPTLTYATNTQILVQYGNASATTDDDAVNSIDANYVSYWPLDNNYGSGVSDLKGTNNATNSGSTDIAGQIGRGRQCHTTGTKHLTVADSNSLTFGNGTVDSPFTLTGWMKRDAVNHADTLFGKGNGTTLNEYNLVIDSAAPNKWYFRLDDPSASAYIYRWASTTIGAGSWVFFVATYDGSSTAAGIHLYTNGSADDGSTGSGGTYVAMENKTSAANIGRYWNGPNYANAGIDEITLSSVVRSADWIKAMYNAGLGTWISSGAENAYTVPVITDSGTGTDAISVQVISSTVSIADSGTGIDEVLGITVNFAINETATGTDSILAFNGQLVGVTDVGAGTDIVSSIIANFILSESASGGDAVSVSGGTVSNIVLESTPIWPSGQVVEYQMVDEYQAVITAWTSTGIFETAISTGYSTYSVKIGMLSQYIIMFRIPSTTYLAKRTVDIYETNNNVATSTMLAASSYTAPDNTGIASILTVVTLLNKYVKNKKEIKLVGGVNRLYIYDDNGTTPLIDKALKDSSGNDITALVAGVLAIEGASSV